MKLAVDYAPGYINARGVVRAVRLHDVPNHVREVALHGVCRGSTIALAVAQVRSSHELRRLPQNFLATDHPEDHERLVDDFYNAAYTISLSTLARYIVGKVFSSP